MKLKITTQNMKTIGATFTKQEAAKIRKSAAQKGLTVEQFVYITLINSAREQLGLSVKQKVLPR
jgi:hypothetical protein